QARTGHDDLRAGSAGLGRFQPDHVAPERAQSERPVEIKPERAPGLRNVERLGREADRQRHDAYSLATLGCERPKCGAFMVRFSSCCQPLNATSRGKTKKLET